MAARFQPGELVDLTIRGARVGESTSKHQQFTTGGGDLFIAAELLPSITIERLAPAEWPPQHGDLWHDRDGVGWLARHWDGLELASDAGNSDHPDVVLAERGPMTLVYRKGWTPTPAADVDQADEAAPQIEGRAAIVAGLRRLADILEASPGLPLPSSWDLGVDTGWAIRDENWRSPTDDEQIARIAAWAAAFDVEHKERRVGDKIHHTAQCKAAGLQVHMSCIVAAPDGDVPPPPPEEVAGRDVAAPGPATAPDFELGPVPHERCPHPEKRHQRHTCTDEQGTFDCPGLRSTLTDDQIDGALVALAEAFDANPELLADVAAVESDPAEVEEVDRG